MNWPWIIGTLIVLMTLAALSKLVARFVIAFSIAASIMLAIHFRHDPAEAGLALAALGGAGLARRPILRLAGWLGWSL